MQMAATPRERPRCRSAEIERDENARARGADRMAERTGAAVHVHALSSARPSSAHRRHDDDGERFVDLPEVDVLRRPADAIEQATRWHERARS